jgi:hypothetical protein
MHRKLWGYARTLTVHSPSKYGKIYSEDSGLRVCDTASWGELLPTFRKTVVPSSSRVRTWTCSLVSLPVKIKALRFFETTGTIHLTQSVQYQTKRNPSKIRGFDDIAQGSVGPAMRVVFVTKLPVVCSPVCRVYRLTCPTQTWELASLWGMPGKWELSLFWILYSWRTNGVQ